MTTRVVRTHERNLELRQTWFDAAHDVLATDGYGGLKLHALCGRLSVTTGSFYHSFDSWQEFTDALLADWRRDRISLLASLEAVDDDPVRQLEVLAEACVGLKHSAERAIRVWAAVDERVRVVQERVDAERFDVTIGALTRLVGPELAQPFAVWGQSVLVGYEQLADGYPVEHLAWALAQVLAAAVAVSEAR